MARPKSDQQTVQLSVRVAPEVAAELDALTAETRRSSVVGAGSRVDVLRAAIVRGLAALRAELGSQSGSRPKASGARSGTQRPVRPHRNT